MHGATGVGVRPEQSDLTRDTEQHKTVKARRHTGPAIINARDERHTQRIP
jgi:hypothetical protein